MSLMGNLFGKQNKDVEVVSRIDLMPISDESKNIYKKYLAGKDVSTMNRFADILDKSGNPEVTNSKSYIDIASSILPKGTIREASTYSPTGTIYLHGNDAMIKEMAHAYRDNQYGSEGFAAVKDWFTKNPWLTKQGQIRGYNTPGHFERDTHRIVEVNLNKYINGEFPIDSLETHISNGRMALDLKDMSNLNNRSFKSNAYDSITDILPRKFFTNQTQSNPSKGIYKFNPFNKIGSKIGDTMFNLFGKQ